MDSYNAKEMSRISLTEAALNALEKAENDVVNILLIAKSTVDEIEKFERLDEDKILIFSSKYVEMVESVQMQLKLVSDVSGKYSSSAKFNYIKEKELGLLNEELALLKLLKCNK
jgi:hypothetical protein